MDYFPTKDLLPLFSQSKINECHADITFPTHYNLDKLLSEEEQEQLRPWEDRKDILFFRGSSTGKAHSFPTSILPYTAWHEVTWWCEICIQFALTNDNGCAQSVPQLRNCIPSWAKNKHPLESHDKSTALEHVGLKEGGFRAKPYPKPYPKP